MTVAAILVLLVGLSSGIPALLGTRTSAPRAAHFPGQPPWPGPTSPLRLRHWLVAASLLTVGVVGLLAMEATMSALVLAVVGSAVPGALAWRINEYARTCEAITAAISAYAPRIAMPYAGKVGVHVGMWSPWIDRTGVHWCIVAHNNEIFDELAAMYETPVVLGTIPNTVRGALYPHGATKNSTFLSADIPHAFLGHGDSDKPLSASERVLDYDIITVAGQAAIDRFALAGLTVPPAKLRIIGRPQTEGIKPLTPHSGPTKVLYAPTWRHADDDLNVSSLRVADQIVAALLERGCTVNFRRHFAGRNHAEAEAMIERVWSMLEADASASGRAHGWGWSAVDQPLIEAFNQADVLVSDISGIVVDFMASLKPLVMYAAQSDSPAEFRTAHPSAEAAYIIDRGLTRLDSALDDALGDDPLAQQRTVRAEYFLGGPLTVNPQQRFMDLVRELAEQPSDLPTEH